MIFSKTSYKAGRQLLSLAKFCGKDMFSRKYRLISLMETNDIVAYAVFKVAPVGNTSAKEYKLWNDFLEKAKEIQVHEVITGEPVPF